MFALTYREYGGPEVLTVEEVPEPHAGPGQVRIRVRAASVNVWDVKVRSGRTKDAFHPVFPVVPGVDASGVVDEVGAGVAGVEVGDEVFGLGSDTTAQFAVLDGWAHKPDSMTWAEAAACALASETAQRALEDLKYEMLRQDRWRELTGDYIERGPFAKDPTGVTVRVLQRDAATGRVQLRVTPVHGDRVYRAAGDEVSRHSELIDHNTDFWTDALRLSFAFALRQAGAGPMFRVSRGLRLR